MTDSMEIWNALRKTDPKHTKDFKRAGGFSGTAIKPMYAIQKMTENFGPCGIGWGYTEPKYTVQDAGELGVLVYCNLSLWYKHAGEKSDLVPGSGGDFAIGKNKFGLNPDDEAFKKAMTDALMNAMKHIGMSADIHMNQFDASKYYAEEKQAPKPVAAPKEAPTDKRELVYLKLKAAKKEDNQDLFLTIWQDNNDFINELAVSDNEKDLNAFAAMTKLNTFTQGE